MRIELANGYALRSAPEREFGINYAIYRNVNPEFEDFLEYGSDLEGINYCFWIFKHEAKIGGVIMRPNHIEGLFLRPPHETPYGILQSVLPVLRTWSARDQPIEAVEVMPSEVECYQRLGFRISHGRRVYVRPTERFDIQWREAYRAAAPAEGDVSDLTELFLASFRDYPKGWQLGTYDLDQWTERVEKRLIPDDMPDLCRRASTVVREASRGHIVGACTISLQTSNTRPDNPYAGISMIGVRPEHRRQGIATQMVRMALDALHGHRPTLKFGVAAGNPAEAFYHSMGFLAGPAHYVLNMPP